MKVVRPVVPTVIALTIALSAALAQPGEIQTRYKVRVFVQADELWSDGGNAQALVGSDGKVAVLVQAADRDEESGLFVLRAEEFRKNQRAIQDRIRKSDRLRLVGTDGDPKLKLTLTDVTRAEYLRRELDREYQLATFQVGSLSYRLELVGTGYVHEGTLSTNQGGMWVTSPVRALVDDIEEWIEEGVLVGDAIRVFDVRSRQDSARDIAREAKRSRWLQPVATELEAHLVITVLGRRRIGYRDPISRIDYRLTVRGTDYETETHIASGYLEWRAQAELLVDELEDWVEDNYDTLAR